MQASSPTTSESVSTCKDIGTIYAITAPRMNRGMATAKAFELKAIAATFVVSEDWLLSEALADNDKEPVVRFRELVTGEAEEAAEEPLLIAEAEGVTTAGEEAVMAEDEALPDPPVIENAPL